MAERLLKILVVHGDPVEALVCRDALRHGRHGGAHVDVSRTGAEALDRLRDLAVSGEEVPLYDAVVVDADSCDEDAPALVGRLAEALTGASVVALCPDARSNGRDAAGELARAGAVDVVAKTPDFARHLPSIVRLNADRSRLLVEIDRQRRQLLELAARDELTDLANRRRFNEVIDLEVERAQRFHRALTLVLFDLDALKHVNDTHGHPGGDAAIRHIAHCLRAEIRRYEVAARIGGDEFAVLLVDTNFDQGRFVAEKLRRRIADAALPDIGQVTISAGVASLPAHAQTAPELIRIADTALYAAKRGGRNRVVVSHDVRQERSGERHPIRFKVVISGRDSEGLAFSEETETELVSRQGARIVTSHTIEAGQHIRLRTPFHETPLTAEITACYRGLDDRWHVGFRLVNPPRWGA